MRFRLPLLFFFLLSASVLGAQSISNAIQSTPCKLKVAGFSLSFSDCEETTNGDVVLIGRFGKGRDNVFDSVYRVGHAALPDWVDIDTSTYHDSCPDRILVHKVNSKGDPIWTRLYDFGFWGIKMDMDRAGFIYVLSNTYCDGQVCPVVTKIDDSGEVIWIKELGIDRNSNGKDIAISESNEVGILATTRFFKGELEGGITDSLQANWPMPNSRFVLLNHETGNIISDTSYDMNKLQVFNYPRELKCYKNTFYAHIMTPGIMSTWSQIVEISKEGTIDKFNPTYFVANSLYGEPSFTISSEGRLYISGLVSKKYSDHEVLILNTDLTKRIQKSNGFYGRHNPTYPVSVDDGLLIVGYDDYTNRIIKYSKSLKKVWSVAYYDYMENGVLFPESRHERGIVIDGVVPSNRGGCYLMGWNETETYENYAVVYALNKYGKQLW